MLVIQDLSSNCINNRGHSLEAGVQNWKWSFLLLACSMAWAYGDYRDLWDKDMLPAQWTQASCEKGKSYLCTWQSFPGDLSAKTVKEFSQQRRAHMKFATIVIVQGAFLWPCLSNNKTPQPIYIQNNIHQVNFKQNTHWTYSLEKIRKGNTNKQKTNDRG